jgi:hypothetical protein
MENNKSEVARLMRQITEEYQAAKLGMQGPAVGSTKHQFITSKMERMHDLHESLVPLVGPQQAIICLGQALEQTQEHPGSSETAHQDGDTTTCKQEEKKDGSR